MPTLELAASPHASGLRPVTIHYREYGSGAPLLFLHGGWGYGIYPFDRQIEAFGKQFRIVITDRSGYGHSTRLTGGTPLNFHALAAEETVAVLDALGIRKAVLWGHSDGSVIAAMMGVRFPERCERLILEAFHFLKKKPRSRGFFERFASHAEDLGVGTQSLLSADHGEDDWQRVVQRNCGAWLRIADAARQGEDLYDKRLGELTIPTLFVHGRLDPRTEPYEMDCVSAALPQATIKFIENGMHSPHSEEAAYAECNRVVEKFLAC
jgi:pimeloyl-ACP methyl ester carboxylesterase